MNAFQSIGFIDNATPQQLQQMVAARNPYSYLALSRLQTIRDNKLKADAKQPESPPLSQVIPQQIAQLENKGIASLPQQAPQMPPAGMPPQMSPQQPPQQPPMQAGIGSAMAPAGAAGGLVSFKHGGIAHFQVGGNTRTIPLNDAEALNRRLAIGDIFGRTVDAATGRLKDVFSPLGTAVTAVPRMLGMPPSLLGDSNEQPPVAAEISTPKTPAQQTQVGADVTANPNMSMRTDFSTPPERNVAAPQQQGTGIRNPNLDAAFKAKTDFLTDIEKQKPKGYVKEDFEALRRNQDTDTMAAFKKLKETLPSESAAIRTQIKDLQKANESESAQAPAMAMLKMATSMMATKSPFFLQALGEAGGAGLEDYQKIMALQKQQKLKLLESDANMAAAQDARNQNLLGIADAKTERSIKDKQDAYHLQRDAEAQEYALKYKIGAIKANIPLEKIELGSKLRVVEAQIAHLTRLPVPDQIQVYQYAQKNPEFRNYMQKQQNAARIEQYSQGIGRDYEVLRKSAALDPSIQVPDYDTFYDQRLNAFMRGIDKVSGTTGAIRGSLQIPQSPAQRTQSPFLPQ